MEGSSYSLTDAAAVLGVSVPTARAIVARGQLASFRTPGGHLKIPSESVAAYRDGRPNRTNPANTTTMVLQGRRDNCWKFDRFARFVSHLLRALEIFQTLGIDFVSFSEQLDTSAPTGKMVFTVLGAVAELERSLIVERVRAGMRNARAKGKRIGRPPRTYLNQDARRSISEAYSMGGASLRQLAVRFGTSIGTVQRCIQQYQKVSTQASLSV